MERSGQVTATVALRVTVRDLDTLDDLGGVLVAHPSLNVHGVTWHVDWDNPAWPQVRAAAIDAAIGKALHYAAALGATLQHVEHIADTGLLGSDTAPVRRGPSPRPSPPAPALGSQEFPRSIPYRRNSSPPSRPGSAPPKYPCRVLKAVPGN